MKILHYSLKTLDELDEAKACKKVEVDRIIIERATPKSELPPLDSDLTTAIESFDPLDPF